MESELLCASERIKKKKTKHQAFCCLNDRILQTTLIPQQLGFSCPGKQINQASNQPIISLTWREHPKGWFHSITQTTCSQMLGNMFHKKIVCLPIVFLAKWSPDHLLSLLKKAYNEPTSTFQISVDRWKPKLCNQLSRTELIFPYGSCTDIVTEMLPVFQQKTKSQWISVFLQIVCFQRVLWTCTILKSSPWWWLLFQFQSSFWRVVKHVRVHCLQTAGLRSCTECQPGCLSSLIPAVAGRRAGLWQRGGGGGEMERTNTVNPC